MPTRVTIVTPPLPWSRRKLDMMRRDILQQLAQQGAPNCEWIEQGDAPPAEPQATHLHLGCGKCGHEWYAVVFTPCPQGCGRESVNKRQSGRVVPPPEPAPVAGTDGAPPHATPSTEPPVPASPETTGAGSLSSQEAVPTQPVPVVKAPGKAKLATFACGSCKDTWQAEKLTACPRCNSKVVMKQRPAARKRKAS